jgi:spermidine synthase
VVGCLNAAVAIATTRLFFDQFQRRRHAYILMAQGAVALGLLAAGAAASDRLTTLAEEATFADPIVWSGTSPYQRVVVTQGRAGFQLFINGNLQFASADEHRYHEALVHPAMGMLTETSSQARSVLVLGGGDGLAVRELLRYPQVARVRLVDLDPMMTTLARELPLLVRQNGGALHDPRVEVVNEDAFTWATAPERAGERFDLVIADFPDPTSFSLGKLYTTHFYERLASLLAPDGSLVVQATSPVLARRAFWCVAETLRAAGLFVRAYHAPVPSFGEWGYLLASPRAFEVPRALPPIALKFLTEETLPTLFALPADMAPVETEINRLNNQILVSYYEEDWSRWN